MSWGQRPDPDKGVLEKGTLDEAAQAVLKTVRVCRDYDVPYVGSCNRKGDTVYIDKSLPIHLTSKGIRYDIDRYIVMHEVVEMLFEHSLHFQYRDAHQLALRLERALVESDGLSWSVYSRFCTLWSKKIGGRRTCPNPPPDIDLEPERDEKDQATLRKMARGRAAKA